MKNVLDKIYFSISQLQVEEKTKAHYRRRASKYFNECGCSLGGFFLMLALAGSLFYWIFFDPAFLPSVKGIVLIVAATLLGKFTGIGIGRIKLLILFRKLSKERTIYGDIL